MDMWRDRLQEARDLRKKGAKLVYKRAVKLREVYKSDGFQQHCAEVGRQKDEYLDDEVSDLFCDFKLLMVMLEHFPKEADWANNKLTVLAAKAVQANKADEKGRKPATERVKWKDKYIELEGMYQAVVEEKQKLEDEISRLAKSLQ